MTFGSLFAGIGGFDLGLERAGMECRWQVEIDDYASRVLAKHWPHVARWGDVRTFPPGSPDEWQVDLICAGVPCQPVSVAGKQRGKDDERWMWGECLRIVADLQPSVFMAENPTALLSDDGGRTFAGIIAAIQAAGYGVEWQTIAAADLGAPHRRERVFLVARQIACMGEVPVLRGLPLHDTRDSCPRLQLPSHRDLGGAQREPIRAENDLAYADGPRLQGAMLEHSSEGLSRPCRREGRDEEQELPDAALWWWPPEPDVGRVAHGVSSRVDRLRCLGNAVVPQIVELIGRAIIASEGAVQ